MSTSPQNPNIFFNQTYLQPETCCENLINHNLTVAFHQRVQVEVEPCVLLMYVKVTLIEETHCAQIEKRWGELSLTRLIKSSHFNKQGKKVLHKTCLFPHALSKQVRIPQLKLFLFFNLFFHEPLFCGLSFSDAKPPNTIEIRLTVELNLNKGSWFSLYINESQYLR